MRKPVHPRTFLAQVNWLDGTPILPAIEPYRLRLFYKALYTFRADGSRQYNLVLSGRAKKNAKTLDLVLAALYHFLAIKSPRGNDCFIIANDEDQANDDLALTKKLIAASPPLAAAVDVQAKAIYRNDGRGSLRILPAGFAVGLHGKTYLFLGIDEMHGYRNYDVLEALAPDPNRDDSTVWITTYDTMYNHSGIPLFDLKQRGIAGADPRMCFDWYSADHCTDPEFATLPAEQRANPSMASWTNTAYLDQQRQRLPAHKYRRLHLNLPGMLDGALFDPAKVEAVVIVGRSALPHQQHMNGGRLGYVFFVDMSGGSADDAVLCVAYHDPNTKKYIVAALETQTGRPPFDPRQAAAKFSGIVKQYGGAQVLGDKYAGNTFVSDFNSHGISYAPSSLTKHELYEEFEPLLNAGRIELPDHPKLIEQLLGLVMRGTKIDHVPGEHDDCANGAAGALVHLHMSLRQSAGEQLMIGTTDHWASMFEGKRISAAELNREISNNRW